MTSRLDALAARLGALQQAAGALPEAAQPDARALFDELRAVLDSLREAGAGEPLRDSEGRAGARRHTEAALELLAVAGGVLASSLDETTMIRRTVRLVVPTLADWCAVNVLDEQRTVRLVALAHIDQAEEQRLKELSRTAPLDPKGAAGVARVLRSNETEFCPDASRVPALDELRVESYLCVPLSVRQHLIGSMTLATRRGGRRYTPEDVAIAEVLARRVALAIDNSRLYRAEQQERARAQQAAAAAEEARAQAEAASRRLAFLAEADFLLFETLDFRTRLQRLARHAVPAIAEICVVDLLDEDEQLQRIAVAHADPSREALFFEQARRFPPIPDLLGPLADTWRSGRPQLLSELEPSLIERHARNREHLRLLRQIGIFRSMIIVPLKLRDRTLGALSLGRISGPAYQQADLELAEELARRAALAIDNARLYQTAQEAVRLRDMLFSVAAHELRTPITSLLGQAQLLERRAAREGHLSERDRRSTAVIAAQAQRLSTMINSLLDIARLEQGGLQLDVAPLDLSDLARRVVEEIQPTAERHTLLFETRAAPLMIVGDALRLEQVLQNLVSNALKYSPAGGAVRVTVEQRDGLARVSVADEGIGIPADALPNLFQRFFRAGNAESQTIGGMGLGLYVVKEIVSLHGGTVAVESSEGRGSTFSICLPLPPSQTAP